MLSVLQRTPRNNSQRRGKICRIKCRTKFAGAVRFEVSSSAGVRHAAHPQGTQHAKEERGHQVRPAALPRASLTPPLPST